MQTMLQQRIKFLEENVTSYQNKDEEYVEMMIRSAAFEQWVAEDEHERILIFGFQKKVAVKTKLTLRLLHKEIDKHI